MKLGGFLILGHDVDKYTPEASNRLWDQVILIVIRLNSSKIMTGSVKTSFTNHFSQYSFEKMQSFSGVMSQLNFCLKSNEIYLIEYEV